jgi:hypothetical protein
MACHILTYFIVGSIAYPLLYKPLFATVPSLHYLRTPDDPILWHHVMQWIFPGQALRGLLFGIALFPFYKTLLVWQTPLCALAVGGIYYCFAVLGSNCADPGSIEGLLYLKPEMISLDIFLKSQPESLVQAFSMGYLIALLIRTKRRVILKGEKIA